MEHVYKWLGSDRQAEELWKNKEALEKYISRLKDFWDEENQEWSKTIMPSDMGNLFRVPFPAE